MASRGVRKSGVSRAAHGIRLLAVLASACGSGGALGCGSRTGLEVLDNAESLSDSGAGSAADGAVPTDSGPETATSGDGGGPITHAVLFGGADSSSHSLGDT
jgi:hypothetical protein